MALATAALLIAAAPSETDQRAEREVAAAEGARNAADEMVELTRQQIMLGWLTIAGLVLSLSMTARAVMQTDKSLKLTQATAKQQLRPYLDRGAFIFEGSDGRRAAIYRLINRGLSPALQIEWRMRVGTFAQMPRLADLEERPWGPLVRTADIAPGADQGFRGFLTGTPEIMAAAERGERFVGLQLEASYTDAWGERHWFRLCEARNGPDLEDSTLVVD